MRPSPEFAGLGQQESLLPHLQGASVRLEKVNMKLEHFFLKSAEVVIVNGESAYLVDRDQSNLTNLVNPMDVYRLVYRQFGRPFHGLGEVLELYVLDEDSEHDPDRRIIIDSSPQWLAKLKDDSRINNS